MTNKRVAVYIRFGSWGRGFVLPDEREEYNAFMNRSKGECKGGENIRRRPLKRVIKN